MPNLLQKILLPRTARPRTATRTRPPAIKPSPEKPGWKQKIPGENFTGKSSNPNLHPIGADAVTVAVFVNTKVEGFKPPQRITVESISVTKVVANGGSTMKGHRTGGWHIHLQEDLILSYFKLY
uniref:Uncharacterized protein n=1 Tax=Setaria viridis TaxID=4556 RepID=A0A4U6T782_SETVI|nr:hypothetical protein SEVIR_9G510000v2 [Setaria viridis]